MRARSGDDLPIPDELTALHTDSRRSLDGLFESAPALVGDLSLRDADPRTLEQLRERLRAAGSS